MEVIKILLYEQQPYPLWRASPSAENYYPLYIATLNGNLEIVKELTKFDLGPNALNSCLVDACYYGDYIILNYLIQTFPDIDPQYGSNQAILISTLHGIFESVEILLNDGRADPNVIDMYNMSPLLYSINLGYENITRLLLNNSRVVINSGNSSPLVWACTNGNVNIFKMLVETEKYNLTAYNNLCIIEACKKGNLEIIKILIEKGVPPNTENDILIISATKRGYTDIVKLLLNDTSVNPAIKNHLPLRNACGFGRSDIVFCY